MRNILELTEEQVRTAYKKCGYLPAKCMWIDEYRRKCCPLTALYLYEKPGGVIPSEDSIENWADREFGGLNYAFRLGYDGDSLETLGDKNDPEFIKAFELGVEFRFNLLDD